MVESSTFVIVGGGLAGAKAAEALRDKGFDGRIVLLCEERHLPYERPPLSKEFLAGKKSLADFTVHDSDWYRDHDVDLRLGVPVSSVDPAGHTVGLSDDTTVRYDKLLLATGSRSRRLPITGSDAGGVYHLRTFDDGSALDSVLSEGTSLAIVGAGWIGLEVAASARQRGVNVTVVETAKQPLMGALGAEAGEVFATLHRDHGVDLRLQAQVDEISTADGAATGCGCATGRRSAPTPCWWLSARSPTSNWPSRPGWRWATAGCWSTRRCGRAIPTSTRSATSPPPNIRCLIPGYAPSTGPMRSNSRRWRWPACWVSRRNTPSCPTSSPTSTTWAW